MAEYYPLISRAVAGLRNGTPESRRAIYDRAKQALIAQLRAIEPPVPEEDIARESQALNDAIARVESEVAPTKPSPPADTKRVTGQGAPSIVAQPPPTRPAPPFASNAPTLGGVQRIDAPIVPPRSPPPLRPSPFRSPRATIREDDKGAAAPAAGTEPEVPNTPPPASDQPSPPGEAVLPTAPTLLVSPSDVAGSVPTPGLLLRPSPSEAEPRETTGAGPQPRPAEDGIRPAAPRPSESRRPDLRVFIVAFAALLAVVAVAFTAWKLRDKPEELVRAPSVTKQAEPAGKIIERADDASAPEAVASSLSTTVAGGAASTADNSASASADKTVLPAASPAGSGAAPASAVPATAAADPGIAVAYKAAILVDAPDDPQKVKTFVGTVVWRSETVNPGQDQPIGTAIRGEIDVPDAKVQLVFEMRRNTEAAFPASHTMELKFTSSADGPVGDIKQIDVPQMRREDMPTGDPLAGVPVTITDNYFLVGLTRGGAEQSNLELIRSRNWFDIPLLLDKKRAAKITFEKGTQGEGIFSEALKTWAAAN